MQELREDCGPQGCADPLLRRLVQAKLVPVPMSSPVAPVVSAVQFATRQATVQAPASAGQAEPPKQVV